MGYFGYKRGDAAIPETWDLRQTVAEYDSEGDQKLFKLDTHQSYRGIIDRKTGSYVKEGALQNTDYWSENEKKSIITDN